MDGGVQRGPSKFSINTTNTIWFSWPRGFKFIFQTMNSAMPFAASVWQKFTPGIHLVFKPGYMLIYGVNPRGERGGGVSDRCRVLQFICVNIQRGRHDRPTRAYAACLAGSSLCPTLLQFCHLLQPKLSYDRINISHKLNSRMDSGRSSRPGLLTAARRIHYCLPYNHGDLESRWKMSAVKVVWLILIHQHGPGWRVPPPPSPLFIILLTISFMVLFNL